MIDYTLVDWGFVLAALGALLLIAYRRPRKGLPLPPGPKGLPLIGNALDIPMTNGRTVFREMSAKYGDVMYLNALGQPMIVLGSHEAAVDLLEKRGSNYSDRMSFVMSELCDMNWVLTMQHYGPYWRKHRRALHEFLNPTVLDNYRADSRRDAHRFILNLMEEPHRLLHHSRGVFGAMIMRISYGIELTERNWKYVDIAEAGIHAFTHALVPGKYLVESFPVLRRLPAWAPGAGFKREARAWRKDVRRALEEAWDETMEKHARGAAPRSLATVLHERAALLPDPAENAAEEEVAKNASAVTYAAGADTTISTVQWFFFAMAAHPEAQARAQAELDAVVGPGRLPEVEDQAELPYVNALLKECLRFRSVVPLGIPHRSLEDDEYRGYLIPKGSMIIANIWAFSRDPEVYPDPEAFRPERFLKNGRLNPEVRDPAAIAFGYGRRVCPGKAFAERSLFSIVSTALHTLSISARIGEDGKPVPMAGEMTEGVLSYPEPFDCVIKPRSSATERLVRASCGAHA